MTLPIFSSIMGSVKIVIKVLVVIGCVIGIVTSLLGLLDAQSKAAFTDAEVTRVKIWETGKLSAFIVGALIFGLIASGKQSGRQVMVIFGVLLIGCGVFVMLMKSYIPGVIFASGGLISGVGAIVSKDIE